jgi:hypothetical protein
MGDNPQSVSAAFLLAPLPLPALRALLIFSKRDAVKQLEI